MVVVVRVVLVVEVVGEVVVVCVGVCICEHVCVGGICVCCVVCRCARGAQFRQAGVSSVPWRISWADSQDEIKGIETSEDSAANLFFPEKS